MLYTFLEAQNTLNDGRVSFHEVQQQSDSINARIKQWVQLLWVEKKSTK